MSKSHAAALAAKVNKRLESASAGTLLDAPAKVEVISTGIGVVDHHLLGCGGLPVGRLVEVFGPEASGKTSLVWACLAAVQRQGGTAVLLETEHAMDPERAAVFGVDLAELLVVQPDTIEDVAKAASAVMQEAKRGPILVAWDSIAATPTSAEVEDGLGGEARMGSRAKALSGMCRLLPQLASKHRTALLFVNQVRDSMNAYGPAYTTPGGKAVGFYASTRLQLFGGKGFEGKDGDQAGRDVTFKVEKNRFAPPLRKSRVRLNYQRGWDDAWTTLEHAKDRKLVRASARGAKALVEAQAALGWTQTGEVPEESDAHDSDGS